MTFLTLEKLKSRTAAMNSNYWREGADYRWEYMSYVIDMLKIMGAKNVIEAGASRMPLCDESRLMDYPENDLNKTPWNVPTGFDCFLALQVWEHLDKQADAFREVMRISKAAILSFPYKWKHGDARHRGIDEKRIADWTCGVEPVHVHKIKNRIVYVWRF